MDRPHEEFRPRILIADGSKEIAQKILKAPGAQHYIFEIATHGYEALSKIEQFHPQLIYLDLMLHEMHGIELLKKIRQNPHWKDIGVIIASSNPMIQNYHAAVKEGANYFLKKPFEIEFLIILFDRFFANELSPDPFSSNNGDKAQISSYFPKLPPSNSYIKFWGTRGSNPVSGTDYVRFGGNTSCLEIRYGEDLIIIDAGTGIRPLGYTLDTHRLKTVHLFFSHTHWDHITGFPFFQPLYQSGVQVIIWSPIGFEKSTQELFTDMLAYAYFPVRIDDIKAKLVFKDLRDGHPVSIGDITIETHYAYHPGATLCFKIHVGGKTYGYATDNEMFLGYHGNPNAIGKDHPLIQAHESIINFFKNCDYLIHEAQYPPQEYQKRVGWGHSSITNATLLVKYCNAKEWIVTHHDPNHTDEDLLKKQILHRDILEDCHIHCHIQLAYDGMVIPIQGSPA